MAAEQPALHLLYRHIDDMNAGSTSWPSASG